MMEQVGAHFQTVQRKNALLAQAEARITGLLLWVRYVKNAMASAKSGCYKFKQTRSFPKFLLKSSY
ncbi:MAG: hypothetical protein NTX52_05430 [Planctomycetota bacterium]|nr:hypothetical protein [Planctomycetota bacterium]